MLLTISDCLDRVESLSLSDLYTSASQLPRSGWVRQNIPDPETVSEHQMSAALMVTELFRDKIRRLGVDILTVQDALLIHDLAESDPRVTDRTPHDVYDPESHKKMEERVIREILAYDPRLIELWLNYEYGRTPEGRLAMEFDKLQAIAQADSYERSLGIRGLVEEFYTNSVTRKKQIQTDFLLAYADSIYAGRLD